MTSQDEDKVEGLEVPEPASEAPKKKHWRQVKKEKEAAEAKAAARAANKAEKAKAKNGAAAPRAPIAGGRPGRKAAGPFPAEVAALIGLKKRKLAEVAELDRVIAQASAVLKKVKA